jgi:hypothetical protein
MNKKQGILNLNIEGGGIIASGWYLKVGGKSPLVLVLNEDVFIFAFTTQ